jgi:two-component system, OmpR family, phosphate regulon sensor histidine kinase PhoR
MGSRPLRQQLWLLVALLCSVTLAVTLVSLLGLRRQGAEVTELTDVTGPALSLNSAVLQTMTNAETGLRGYIATENPVLLAPYNGAERQASVQLSELGALLGKPQLSGYDPSVAARRAAEQEAAVARWWQYAAVARAEGRRAQTGLVAGKATFDQVRSANAAVASTLLADQHVLRSRAGQTVTYYLAALLAVTALALLAGLAVAGRLSRTVTGPISRLRLIVQRQRDGHAGARADEDDGPVEIRDLATAFNALSTRNTELAAEQAEAIRLQQEAAAIGRAIRFAASVQEALEVTCAQLGTALGASRVRAAAIDETPQVTASAEWHAPGLDDLPARTASHESGFCRTAAELWASAGQLVLNDLPRADAEGHEWAGRVLGQTGTTALILVPAGLGDRVVGAVTLSTDTGPRTWTASEVAVVQQVANFLARAVVQAEHDVQSGEYTARLESLDRQKTEFLSTVSHELRTPLTSIQGYLELLRDGDAGPVADAQQHMLGIIERNATRLRALIEDILVLNRIETGGLILGSSEVPLRELTANTAEELQPLADKASVELRLHVGADPGPVIGDRMQLQRALVNILSNAIKFTPKGGTVTLTCRTDQPGEVTISCQDTGIGIPKADIEHLFTRFFRASNATGMAIPGTGLGLAIVAAIVDVHHGRLNLDSAEGKGTTITLHFPLAAADTARTGT